MDAIVQTPVSVDLWEAANDALAEGDRLTLQRLAEEHHVTGPFVQHVDETISALNRKRELCRNDWSITLKNSKINLRQFVDQITGWLFAFKEVGDALMQFDPTHLALPWAGIRFIIMATSSGEQESRDTMLIVGKVASIVYRCRVLERLYIENWHLDDSCKNNDLDSVSRLQGAIVKLYTHILVILASYHRHFDHRRPTRAIIVTFNPYRAKSFLHVLETLEEEVLKHADICQSGIQLEVNDVIRCKMDELVARLADFEYPICRIEEGVERLLDDRETNRWRDILEWISDINVGTWHDDIVRRRTRGTCNWLLEHDEFKHWKQSKSSGVFWLCGPGGSGKTFLTSNVVDELRAGDYLESNESFAYFYCRGYEPPWNSASHILRSLFRQLATFINGPVTVHRSLEALYNECHRRLREPSLVICTTKMREIVETFDKTTIVLDGYQEIDNADDENSELLQLLLDLVSESPRTVKVFITCRPQAVPTCIPKGKYQVSIDASAVHDDISLFVEIEAKKHRKWVSWDEDVRNKVIAVLTDPEKHQGIFQWVAFHVKELRDVYLSKQVGTLLASVPSGLLKTYEKAYRKIQQFQALERDLAIKVFQWVSCSPVPMNMAELLYAIHQPNHANAPCAIEGLDESDIYRLTAGLLLWDGSSEGWRFGHFTIAEYLQSNYVIYNKQTTSRIAANLCLKTLTWKEGDDDKLPGKWKPDAAFLAFSDYARWCWPIHLRNSHARGVAAPSVETNLPRKASVSNFFGTPLAVAKPYHAWVESVMRDKPPRRFTCTGLSRPSADLLEPTSCPVFGMCILGIEEPLTTWLDTHIKLDVNARNARNWSLLSLAIHHRHPHIWKLLLHRGAVCTADGSYCGNPLATAASVSPEATRDILDYGIDPNLNFYVQSPNDSRRFHIGYGTPLAAAALEGELECIEILTDAGANVNQALESLEYPSSALAIAAWRGNTQAVEKLIARGADINMELNTTAGTAFGSALAAASAGGHISAMKALLRNMTTDDVNKKLKTAAYGSALAAAAGAWKTNPEAIKLLIDHGAQVNDPLPCGYGSALAAAAFALKGSTENGQMGQALKDFMVKMRLQDAPFHSVVAAVYDSPLKDEIITHQGDAVVVQLLLEYGAEVMMPLAGQHKNALNAAQKSGNEEVLQLMMAMLLQKTII